MAFHFGASPETPRSQACQPHLELALSSPQILAPLFTSVLANESSTRFCYSVAHQVLVKWPQPKKTGDEDDEDENLKNEDEMMRT